MSDLSDKLKKYMTTLDKKMVANRSDAITSSFDMARDPDNRSHVVDFTACITAAKVCKEVYLELKELLESAD